MTLPDLTNLYKTRAAARLSQAGLLLRNNPAHQFTTTPDADLARSDIGMMIWSASIDLGSILLIQERQIQPTGRSPQISQFITRDLHQQHPLLSLNVAWSMLVQLHNIQHRAGHSPSRFATAATEARRSIAALNYLLQSPNRIDPGSYSWLARVRDQYVDPFRDDPLANWVPIQPETLNTPHPATGSVPLHWAAQNLDPNAIDILVTHGARIDARDNSRQTPLHRAARSGWPRAIHSLIHHGADVNARSNLASPLHYAAGFNGYDAVEALINSQADVNRADFHHETPLHWAARWQQDAAVAEKLIDAGARRDAQSFTGQIPYDIASASGAYFADLLSV